jgi:hypothetical protein
VRVRRSDSSFIELVPFALWFTQESRQDASAPRWGLALIQRLRHASARFTRLKVRLSSHCQHFRVDSLPTHRRKASRKVPASR